VEARDIEDKSENEFFKIQFGQMKAGNYKLTLRIISTDILSAGLCPGKLHFQVWITHCFIF